MTESELQQLLVAGFPDCEARVTGADGRFSLTVASDAFAGLSPMQRQQQVYLVINEQIVSGAIHAVQIQAFTKDQWREHST